LQRNKQGRDPFEVAASAEKQRALSEFLPPGYRAKKGKFGIDPSNTILSLAVVSKLGLPSSTADFLLYSKSKAEVCWATLRNGLPLCFDESPQDVFVALEKSKETKLWIWAFNEPEMWRHPKSGNTILHLLCRTVALDTNDKMIVFDALIRDFRNPLVPNYRNQRAVDLANDPLLKENLTTYMQFKPNRWVAKWLGPCFQRRAFAFLLVLKRVKPDICVEIRDMLLQYLSKVESIYLPSIV
jgi:hypothetical protein